MAADAGSPRIDAPAPSRRWFWLLLVISVAALILGGVALALELTRESSGPSVVFSDTFQVGNFDTCHVLSTEGGWCDWVNFNLSGGTGLRYLGLATITFNVSCPSSCSVDVESSGLNTVPGGFAFNVSRSATDGGLLSGGPGWLELWESSYCGKPSGNCGFFPVEATVQLEDYGPVPT